MEPRTEAETETRAKRTRARDSPEVPDAVFAVPSFSISTGNLARSPPLPLSAFRGTTTSVAGVPGSMYNNHVHGEHVVLPHGDLQVGGAACHAGE